MERAYAKLQYDDNPNLKEAYDLKKIMKDEIAKTKYDYKFMKMLEQELKRDTWKISKKKGTILGTAKIPGTENASIMVKDTLDVDIFRFLAVYAEPDLVHKWLPKCADSGLIKHIARNELVQFEFMGLPVISDREILMQAVGYERLDTLGEVWIFGETFYKNKPYIKKHNIQMPVRKK